MPSRRPRILFLCGVGHFYAHFFELAWPTLVLWVHLDWDLPRQDVLVWGHPLYLLFGLGSLPMGWLGDRFNNRHLLSLMLVGLGAFSILAGCATTPLAMQICLGGIGLMASVYHPVGLGFISRCCDRRGSAMGHNGIWGSLGIGLAPAVIGQSAHWLGWRGALVAAGLPPILIGLWFAFRPLDETPLPENGPGRGAKRSGVLPFALLLAAMTLLGWIYRGTVVALPLALLESAGRVARALPAADPVTAISWMVSAVYMIGMLGQYVGGRLADRLDLRAGYLGFHALSLPFMLLMARAGNIPLLLAALAYVFCALGMQPVENSLVAALTPVRFRGLAYSLKCVLVFGVGSFAVRMVRAFENQGDISRVFRLQALLLVAVVATVLVLCALTRRERVRN